MMKLLKGSLPFVIVVSAIMSILMPDKAMIWQLWIIIYMLALIYIKLYEL